MEFRKTELALEQMSNSSWFNEYGSNVKESVLEDLK